MLVIIENQTALRDAYPAKGVPFGLISKGLDRQEAMHTIGSVITVARFGFTLSMGLRRRTRLGLRKAGARRATKSVNSEMQWIGGSKVESKHSDVVLLTEMLGSLDNLLRRTGADLASTVESKKFSGGGLCLDHTI